MAVLDIRLEGDPILRKKAAAVTRVNKRIAKLLRDMEETMYAANGIGLAAPQVGHSLRLVVIDVGEGPIHLVNPVLEESEGSEIGTEGCLSIPGKVGYVERFAQVKVRALNEKGKTIRIEADGLLARALQHEIDHLDGILITDRASSMVDVPPEDEVEDDNDAHAGEAVSGGDEKLATGLKASGHPPTDESDPTGPDEREKV